MSLWAPNGCSASFITASRQQDIGLLVVVMPVGDKQDRHDIADDRSSGVFM
jgi:hypothetical protein